MDYSPIVVPEWLMREALKQKLISEADFLMLEKGEVFDFKVHENLSVKVVMSKWISTKAL